MFLEAADTDDEHDVDPRDKELATQAGGPSRRGPSRMKDFLECPARGAYAHLMGYRLRRDRPARLMGRLVHLGLAYIHANLMPKPQRPAWFDALDMQSALRVEAGELAEEAVFGRVDDIIGRYFQDAGGSDGMEELCVEHEFATTVGALDPGGPNEELDDMTITCRSDRVVRDDFKQIWIDDHKTKGRGRGKSGLLPSWHATNEYVLDWQAQVNLQVVRKVLRPQFVAGFTIHRVQRTFPFDRDRNIVRIGALAYAQVPRTIRKAARIEMETAAQLARGEEPDRYFNACYGRFGPCDFVTVCGADTQGERDAILSSDFKRALNKVEASVTKAPPTTAQVTDKVINSAHQSAAEAAYEACFEVDS